MRTLLFAFLLTVPVLAQTDRGTITGTVTDPSGAAIPGVRITLDHLASGESLPASTNEGGQYTKPNLIPGDYRITYEAQGFKKLIRSGITLKVTDVLRVDVKLELGAVADSIEVTADVSRLQTDSPEVGTSLSGKAMIDLPLSFGSGGRHAEDFAFSITPGVSGTGLVSHINGSTGYSKETLVDGASVTVNQSGDQTAALVSPEALQEVKIQTSALSAEFGRTQGGVFNFVMKSGTNQIHGSAYFGLRNEALNANTFANNFRGSPRALDRKQNYAASFGGAVVIPKLYDGHNKTFFYTSYERYKERSYGLGAPTKSEPIPAFYDGDFSRLLGATTSTKDALGNAVVTGAIYDPATFAQLPSGRYTGTVFPGNKIPSSRFSQVSQKLNAIAKAHYIPTVRDPSGQIPLQNNASFPTSGAPEWDHYQFSVKADQVVTANQRLAFSMNHHYSPRFILDSGGMWDPTDVYGGPLAKSRLRGDTGSMGRLGYDWTLSPTVLNHTTLSFNHRGNPQKVISTDINGAAAIGLKGITTKGYPQITWGSGPIVTLDNPGFIKDSYRSDESWSVADTVSFSKGRHYMKAGIDYRRNVQNYQNSATSTFVFNARATSIPNETFSGNTTGYSFASYLLGILDSASITDANSLGGRRRYLGAFIQDDFKLNSRLTLNLGLRWEFQPPQSEAANRQSSWNPNKIDPISGLKGAYDFNGNCSVCNGNSYFGTRHYKDFGPRFGFAYQAPAKFVVRGAYGILYEADSFNVYGGTPLGQQTSLQASGTYSYSADGVTPWAGILKWDNGLPSSRFSPATYDVSWGDKNTPGMFDPNYGKNAYVQQWSLNLQREVWNHTVLDIGYIGNKGTGIKVGELQRINQLPASVLSQYGTKLNNAIRNAADAAANGIAYPYPGFVGTVASALRPYPQLQGNSTVNVYGSPLGFSTYHALQITLNREVRKGLKVYANYVWSKSISNVDSSFVGDNASRPIDYYNLKLEKSVSSYDIPRALKAFVNYDLPTGGNKWVRRLTGGWSVAAILNYYDGTPLGPFTAPTALSSGWNGAVNRPNVAAGDLMNSAFSIGNFELSSPKSAVNTYLNKAAFSSPTPLTLGSGARYYTQIRDFATLNEDLSLQNYRRITEKIGFRLRAEILNAFNRHQLGGVSTSVNNANFGQVTSVSGNRNIQVSARLEF